MLKLDAEFKKMRRADDDPSRTPSKRALLKLIAEARAKKGRLPLDDRTWLICSCGRLSVAARPGEDGDDTCHCGRLGGEMREATRAQIDSVSDGVTINVVRLARSE